MIRNEAVFYREDHNSQKGKVACRLCPALEITPIGDEGYTKATGRTSLYKCGQTRIGLESDQPEASVSRVPGIIGMLAGDQVLIVGVNSWEASFICPNPSVKASLNR